MRPPTPPDGGVLAALGDAIVTADREGIVTGWTGAAVRLFGHSEQETVGRPLSRLFPTLPAGEAEELRTLGGAPRLDAVLHLFHRDGRTIRVAVTATPIPGSAGEPGGTVAVVKPIGGWLDPTETGPVGEQWHWVLGTIIRDFAEVAGQDLAAIDETDALARIVVDQARRMIPDAECMLSIVPPERQSHFRMAAGAGPWAARQVGREWPRAGSVAGLAMAQGRPLETVRLLELSSLRAALTEGDIHTGRLLPLAAQRALPDGRTTLGVLGFYRRERRYFSPYERRLMAEFGSLVSVSLQRAELRRAGAQAGARLQTGVDVALDLAHSLEPREVIRRLVRRAMAAVGAQRATLLSLEGDEAVVEAATELGDADAEPVGRRLALDELVAGDRLLLLEAVRRRRPFVAGPYQLLNNPPEQRAGLEGVRHSVLLPLVLSDQVLAVLVVARRTDLAFDRSDVATLQLIGNVAVLAIRNARLFAEAQEASRLHGDFLNMAAHELRTPLTVISGYLSMLRDGSFGEVPQAWRVPVDLLAEKAAELGRLIDDLLLASRLESGRVPADVQRLDLRDVVQAAVLRAQARVALLGGELVLALPPEPLEVEADREHIARVLDNLVNNALSYGRGPAATAWVRVVAAKGGGGGGGQAVVDIEDRGQGVPEEMRERIFERFVRADDSGPQGTGLGLYISRELAARHGGTVVLDWSEPGRGTCFQLRLPAAGKPH